MPYYPTLTEDIKRAKEILERGKRTDEVDVLVQGLPADEAQRVREMVAGAICGADSYAAYKLLESFVEAIEAVGPKVCELAVRHHKRSEAIATATAKVNNGEPPSITCPRCGMTSYNANDIRERYCGNCHESIPDKVGTLC